VGTALMAQILARKIFRREDSSLFTAAILHDIGKIVLGEFVRDKYAEIKKIVSEQSRSFLEAEEKVLGMNHATLGGMIAANWKFPEDIRNAIAFITGRIARQARQTRCRGSSILPTRAASCWASDGERTGWPTMGSTGP